MEGRGVGFPVPPASIAVWVCRFEGRFLPRGGLPGREPEPQPFAEVILPAEPCTGDGFANFRACEGGELRNIDTLLFP